MLVDTHTHIYLDQFDDDRAEMMQRAKDNGVEKFYLPNIDSSSIDAMLNLEKLHPGTCVAMMGLHPCSVKENYKEELAIVKSWLDKRVFCAIGEIGIDLHWDTSTFEIQKEAFRTQIKWAKELDVPVVIHSRKSTKEVIDVLREEKDDRLRGIFHCFGGSVEEAKSIIDLGFYLGIGGVVTFKKAGLDKTMEDVPLENVVLETDSPYLSPSPYRGKRNESGYVKLVAEKLAAIKNRTLEEVAEITSKNALDIFEK
ncbi:MAG: TatD family hydrolase [Saprospiraceae bacterium]|nr:TatD family hydrolase [Saprospiraceae bacterium]MDG1435740.1 TatD family hydrolase [Saprospiraceae bacterium]MDG2418211.1 TatD family hydrolase [Saprospiraceae bacterium]